MTALQKITENPFSEEVLAKLNPVERKVVLASLGSVANPKLKDLNTIQASKAVDSILLKASVMLGQKKKEGPEYEILLKTISDGFAKFPNLTVREVYIATDNGLEGLYKSREDEPVIFNPSNWYQWVRRYIEDTKKPAMKKTSQVYKQEEKDTEPPTERESLIGRYQVLVKACIDTVETGIAYQDYGGILYDLLVKLELLQPIKEDTDEMKKAAIWILNNAKDLNDKSKVKQAEGLLNKVLAGISDESVLSVASRKVVAAKLKEICSEGEEDAIEFLEVAKEKLETYLNEHE